MPQITVFTPTYNRAHTLTRTYKSLCNQTCLDFIWLIIDDGSTDETELVVKKWINESKINILYIYKTNGGLHTGYNEAIKNIDTELCICCDSDDFLPKDAIYTILEVWNENNSTEIAGIIGLDFDANTGKPIGGFFPKDKQTCHFLEIGPKLKHYGDFKMVVKTELLKHHVPMPTFSNEKNFNPIYIFLKIDPRLNYIIINKNLCFVEYQPSGMSANIFNQFLNSPRSFAELRKVKLLHPRVSLKRKLIDAIHLGANAFTAKDFSIIKSSPKKMIVLPLLPFGMILYFFFKYKTRSKK